MPLPALTGILEPIGNRDGNVFALISFVYRLAVVERPAMPLHGAEICTA
jgi:hypothetical protein